ncbi:MAG: hypothetical protein SF123_07695 [Chloroflexota bacterium]|nr:hypothetical protein [Chloroflexota bacterium]
MGALIWLIVCLAIQRQEEPNELERAIYSSVRETMNDLALLLLMNLVLIIMCGMAAYALLKA